MTGEKLAIDGGNPVRPSPMPARGLITEKEKAAAMRVFDEAIASGNAFGYNGQYEQEYEKLFVEYMGGGFADTVNSGTNAVFCALGGLQLDALSEVIVSPITDPGGAMPVLFVGCVPVFADADLRSFNTNAEQIEKQITPRTRAILVAHIAGEPADMDPIMELAEKHNLYVVEDCAQSHGATYKGRMTGTIGHIAAFSTMFGKHHCTGGQGGVVYSRDETLYWQARRFADRGKPFNITDPTGNVVAGLNCNLNELSAAIGIEQLQRLPEMVERRRAVAERVKAGLEPCKAVHFGWQVPDTQSAYWFMRIKLDLEKLSVGREDFCKALEAEGITGLMSSYRAIPCEHPWFSEKAVFGKSGFPWNCSDYGGDKEPHFPLENAIKVTENTFIIFINESYGHAEADDIVAALHKLDTAYSK